MARTGRARSIDRKEAKSYLATGQTFLDAAIALETLAGEDESYGSAIALLAVHAAISLADAISIGYAGKKSVSGDHRDVVRLLGQALGNRLPDKDRKDLTALLYAKDSVAYQGKYFALNEARALLQKAAAFADWTGKMHQLRPG